jgi:DNA-binding transcriptional regulator PaaX
VTKLEDLLPPGTEAEWTCGHVAGAMCAECYRILAERAHELAEENQRLRDNIAQDQQRLFHYERLLGAEKEARQDAEYELMEVQELRSMERE